MNKLEQVRKELEASLRREVELHYQLIAEIIVDPNSYGGNESIQPALHFIKFIESALYRPYNRLSAIHAMLADMDGFQTKRMRPFASLSSKASDEINAITKQAMHIGECYSSLFPDQDNSLLESETRD